MQMFSTRRSEPVAPASPEQPNRSSTSAESPGVLSRGVSIRGTVKFRNELVIDCNVEGSIDSTGQVTGFYSDASNVLHGFLRKGGGKLVTIDPPGTISTIARGSTADGTVSGYYQDASNTYHGFIRDSAGNYTSFDATSDATITVPLAMNALGQIVGFYVDSVNIPHGFLRNSDGATVTVAVAAVDGLPSSSVTVKLAV